MFSQAKQNLHLLGQSTCKSSTGWMQGKAPYQDLARFSNAFAYKELEAAVTTLVAAKATFGFLQEKIRDSFLRRCLPRTLEHLREGSTQAKVTTWTFPKAKPAVIRF